MASFFTTNPTTAPQGPYVAGDTIQQMKLGSKFVDQSGNAYRYCLVGASALVPGKLYQSPVEITNHENLAPAAAAIGATQVTVTLGATAVTANQYAEGYLVITVTPGQGYRYQIASHPAAALSTTCVLTLVDPIQVALTTSSRADLVSSPYSNVIINPTTATGVVAGAAVYPTAAAAYGFLQTGGVTCLLVDDQTVVVGTNVAASNQAAGAIEPATGVQALVGIAITGGATTEYVAVKLTFDVG